MPFVTIEVRRHWSDHEETAIIEAVHASLIHAFGIPDDDKNIRLFEHAPGRFAVGHTLARPEFRTLVSIDCYSGRTEEMKQALYSQILERFEVIGIPREGVSIVLREEPPVNWGSGRD
ncbi:tautomerase family protein [Demequina sp.]|uniref:tautomerase family protein n=1 Tax=Demequina sp. TaxID=2050685 RepID=UPI003D0FD2DF